MLDNPCLRPSCLSDVAVKNDEFALSLPDKSRNAYFSLKRLYNAEWAKRGYQESP